MSHWEISTIGPERDTHTYAGYIKQVNEYLKKYPEWEPLNMVFISELGTMVKHRLYIKRQVED